MLASSLIFIIIFRLIEMLRLRELKITARIKENNTWTEKNKQNRKNEEATT